MSDPAPRLNPFPGAQPYRAADRDRFFGREELVRSLAKQVLAHGCTILFGPSGAGKSSLMQAGVIPWLEEAHAFRVVRVDAWPPGEAPLQWLMRALFDHLDLGATPEGTPALETLDEAMRLAELRSERPILIYLDQLEQLLFPAHDAGDADALIEGVDRLAQAPIRGLRIVLSLREDYLGPFRDRARAHRDLLDQGYRLGPLTVGEMVKAVCQAAAEGVPAQQWSEDAIRRLMLEVRTPGFSASDDAEVEAAYGQIVCRELWNLRAAGSGGEAGVADAEEILHRYLEATVEGLGGLKEAARRLLEEHLIDQEGHRRLLTENEARQALPAEAAMAVLGGLEKAAVVHAEEHQGGRYFQLGHDWLAARVFKLRQERQREEEERKRREEEAQRLARERAARRRLGVIAAIAMVVAVAMAVLVVWALRERDTARGAEERARSASLMAGARELLARGKPAPAVKLLLMVREPERIRGWADLTRDVLAVGLPVTTLAGHRGSVRSAAFSPDGRRVVSASADKTARVWNADGSGEPVVLRGHESTVLSAAFSSYGRIPFYPDAEGP